MIKHIRFYVNVKTDLTHFDIRLDISNEVEKEVKQIQK